MAVIGIRSQLIRGQEALSSAARKSPGGTHREVLRSYDQSTDDLSDLLNRGMAVERVAMAWAGWHAACLPPQMIAPSPVWKRAQRPAFDSNGNYCGSTSM